MGIQMFLQSTYAFYRYNAYGHCSEGEDTHSGMSNKVCHVSSIEQHRHYQLKLQVTKCRNFGIATTSLLFLQLFDMQEANAKFMAATYMTKYRKAKKGIQFLINGSKVGNSPEEIAAFLKDAFGLNKTDIN